MSAPPRRLAVSRRQLARGLAGSLAGGVAGRFAAVSGLALAPLAGMAGMAGIRAARAGGLQPFVRGSWAAIRAAHAGRPTVVHFWGLTCGPCLVELPDWAAAMRAGPGFDMVTVAADPAPEPVAALTQALAKAGLEAAENWMFDGFSARLRYEVDPEWQGELPMTVLIGRDGAAASSVGVMAPDVLHAWMGAQDRAG